MLLEPDQTYHTYIATCWIEMDGHPLHRVVVRQQAESAFGFEEAVRAQLLLNPMVTSLDGERTVSFGPVGEPWGRRQP